MIRFRSWGSRSVLLMLLALPIVGPAAAATWSSEIKLPLADSGVQLKQPVAMTIDAESQRYYVVDAAVGQLVSFDKDGNFLAAFTAGGELKHPVAMAKTGNGKLWVIERSTNELLYIDPRQKKVQRLKPSYPDGRQIFASGLQLDERDRVYLLDRLHGQVVQLDDNLKVANVYAPSQPAKGLVDFTLRQQQLWLLDAVGKRVFQFNLSGTQQKLIEFEGLEFPSALDVDSAGLLYLLDRHAGILVAYSADGRKKFSFLGKGKRSGQLWNGADLLFDWQGRLCVVDEGNARVEVLVR